jgi:hypothetical protein
MRTLRTPAAPRIARLLIAVGAVLGAWPAAAHAQADAVLDRVEIALAAGRLTEARGTLERWQRERAASAGADEQARALLLHGRLAPDFETARDAYLGVVLAHPSSAAAPDALLRLGQGLTAAGEHARAAAYLDRLIADYPAAPQRADGLLWRARAHRANAQRAPACAAARRADEAAGQRPDLARLIAAELAASCDAPALARGADRDAAARAPVDAAAMRFAVQAGAFRERSGAERTAAMLADAGYDARIVVVEGSALYRVRTGRFESARDAAAAAGRLTAIGYSVIIVDDARNERTLPPL